MKVFVGKEGLKESMQDEFNESIKCPFCNGNAYVAFTVSENFNSKKKEKFICELREHEGIWPHDLMAATVYICSDCGEGSVEWNQA